LQSDSRGVVDVISISRFQRSVFSSRTTRPAGPGYYSSRLRRFIDQAPQNHDKWALASPRYRSGLCNQGVKAGKV